MAGRTQAALYSTLDLELSWSENELPQVERTKHVHSLHPYLGKFIPQLVDVFLRRYFTRNSVVYDPFVGSGTTLVESLAFGADSIGCDISAFNCLLTTVKTSKYSPGELERGLRGALDQAHGATPEQVGSPSEWLRQWFAPQALAELLSYSAAIEKLEEPCRSVAKIILSRAARSARLTTHFDLDFPRQPTTEPYYCFKHKKTCRPVQAAGKFLARYTADTVTRIRAFAPLRTNARVRVMHHDSRTVVLPQRPTGVITSPPYPGLIDYHEQHRYAYELLGLHDRRVEEIGPATAGRGRAAVASYVQAMSEVFGNACNQMESGALVLIVVNDSHDLYPTILQNAHLVLEDQMTRHVNRRTGRRAGEFYEDVLVCRAD